MKNTIALPCLLLCLPALALGCTSAGKCERGNIGCAVRQGVPPSERCESGARVVNGMCVRDSDGSPRDSGTPDTGTEPGADAGAVDCLDDSFEDACTSFCEAFCRNEEVMCVDSMCPRDACEPGGDLYRECDDACSGDADPVGCAVSLCEGQKEFSCEDFGFFNDDNTLYISGCILDDPACVPNADFGCSDLCGTTRTDYGGVGADLAGDGLCQDGGEGSVSSACARGTDCSDCTARECAGGGEGCGGHGDCCGYYENGALCVELSSGPACLVSCTASGSCAEGLRCVEVDDNRNSVCAP